MEMALVSVGKQYQIHLQEAACLASVGLKRPPQSYAQQAFFSTHFTGQSLIKAGPADQATAGVLPETEVLDRDHLPLTEVVSEIGADTVLVAIQAYVRGPQRRQRTLPVVSAERRVPASRGERWFAER
jgi:hypothetical protein